MMGRLMPRYSAQVVYGLRAYGFSTSTCAWLSPPLAPFPPWLMQHSAAVAAGQLV